MIIIAVIVFLVGILGIMLNIGASGVCYGFHKKKNARRYEPEVLTQLEELERKYANLGEETELRYEVL